ncbi:MAG: hypothetical protein ACYTBJ_22425 [Planctomycetota bacterium]
MGDGTTDDTIALQAAYNVGNTGLGSRQGIVVALQPSGGVYRITSPLNLCDRQDIRTVGGGTFWASTIRGDFAGGAGAIIECVGSGYIRFENIRIEGHSSNTPDVGLTTGRTTAPAGSASAQIVLRDCYLTGAYNVGAYYNVSSESNSFWNCFIQPTNACEAGVLASQINWFSVPLTHATYDETLGGHHPRFYESQIVGAQPKRAIYIRSGDVHLDGCYLANFDRAHIEHLGGGAAYIDSTGGEGTCFAAHRMTYDASLTNLFQYYGASGSGVGTSWWFHGDLGCAMRGNDITGLRFLPKDIRTDQLQASILAPLQYDAGAWSLMCNQAFGCPLIEIGLNDTVTDYAGTGTIGGSGYKLFNFPSRKIESVGMWFDDRDIRTLAISSNQPLWSPANFDILGEAYLTAPSGNVTVYGIQLPTSATRLPKRLRVKRGTTNTITFADESASASQAEARINTSTQADVVVSGGALLDLEYDEAADRYLLTKVS